MEICIIAEGCYPYVVGGVSGWINSMIKSFPEIDFSVLAVVPDRSMRGKFVYELPPNVTAVYESYLNDYDWEGGRKEGKRTRLNKREYLALRNVILNQDVDWDAVFDMFQKQSFSIDDLMMGADFLRIVQECYRQRYSQIVFSDFLWTMRSIFLPLFLVLKTPLPKADIYHCVATGYAGVLGSMAKHFYRSGLIISEHGIYTREREEEILKAEWVGGIYKNIWIDQFHKMSMIAYSRADAVTCLYTHAKELQLGLGCPEEKIRVTPNGIDMERFRNLAGKKEEDEGYVNIGAILRVAPIKDVKTLIRAFAFAKEKLPSLKLWIMGPTDEDEDYAKECFELVDSLLIEDVVFTGRINVPDYLGRMDFTILTSISEGQPLTILESFAAHKPVVATDVGCCRELIYGEDDFGTAGILCHIMNTAELAAAMVEMGKSPHLRHEMGENGYKRVANNYQLFQMIKAYREIYEQVGWNYGTFLPAAEETDGSGDDYRTDMQSGDTDGSWAAAEPEYDPDYAPCQGAGAPVYDGGSPDEPRGGYQDVPEDGNEDEDWAAGDDDWTDMQPGDADEDWAAEGPEDGNGGEPWAAEEADAGYGYDANYDMEYDTNCDTEDDADRDTGQRAAQDAVRDAGVRNKRGRKARTRK